MRSGVRTHALKFQLSPPSAAPDRTGKKPQSRDVAVVSRPPCFEPNGSKAEDFGLETEPTSATPRPPPAETE